MAVLDLVLIAVWIGLVAGLRGYLQQRRTGTLNVITRSQRGSPQWWAKLLSSLGFALAIAAPLADLAGLPPFGILDQPAAVILGVALVAIGIIVTLLAQTAMGSSWRGDVDPEARTSLVTAGPFAIVRNPILSATALTLFGLFLIVPNLLSAGMLLASVLGIQIQVRLVEEPYLRRVHGAAYGAYAARVGRFVPLVGRLRP